MTTIAREAVAPELEALRAILAELRLLRAVLEQVPRRPSPGTLSRADRTHLSRVLPAIAGAHGSDPFTARELFEPAAAAGVRLVVRGLNARRVGRLFQRAADVAVEGFTVERHGVELGAVLWRVLASPGNGKVSVPPRPPAGAL